jgi:hypothetical protein
MKFFILSVFTASLLFTAAQAHARGKNHKSGRHVSHSASGKAKSHKKTAKNKTAQKTKRSGRKMASMKFSNVARNSDLTNVLPQKLPQKQVPSNLQEPAILPEALPAVVVNSSNSSMDDKASAQSVNPGYKPVLLDN